jgi:GT2 family glycosyltransferase
MSDPFVCVLTLNWNGKKWLGDCLSSVLTMDYGNFEVVMVDNGSTDGSVQFVHDNFPGVLVVQTGSNLGYARGFNAGLEFAAQKGAEYFLIINNDTVIDRGALSALVETAQNYPRAGFVTGKVYFYDKPDILQTVGKKEHPIRWNGDHIGWLEKDAGQYEAVAERIFLDDVMTLVDRRLYNEVGGYDPEFFLQCEEFDWQARAKRESWKFYYTPKAKLWHRVSMSMGGLGNSVGRYYDIRSQMVVIARYRTPGLFLKYYMCTGFEVVNSFVRGLVQLNWTKIKPRLSMLLGFMGGTFWLVHRNAMRKVPWIIQKLQGSKL